MFDEREQRAGMGANERAAREAAFAHGAAQHHAAGHREMHRHPSLRCVIVITDVEKAETVTALLQRMHLPLHYQFRGLGTANSEILDILGLGESLKSIDLCLAPKRGTRTLLSQLSGALKLYEPGHGIAFTVPLSGVANPIIRMLDKETRQELENRIESEVENVTEQAKHTLILALVNQGFSDDLMEAAKEAGARGGTVIHARRVGMEDTMKFWGISVQEEKEVVAILAQKEMKLPIMKAINKKCGLNTPAHGVVLSLPVDSIVGLDSE